MMIYLPPESDLQQQLTQMDHKSLKAVERNRVMLPNMTSKHEAYRRLPMESYAPFTNPSRYLNPGKHYQWLPDVAPRNVYEHEARWMIEHTVLLGHHNFSLSAGTMWVLVEWAAHQKQCIEIQKWHDLCYRVVLMTAQPYLINLVSMEAEGESYADEYTPKTLPWPGPSVNLVAFDPGSLARRPDRILVESRNSV